MGPPADITKASRIEDPISIRGFGQSPLRSPLTELRYKIAAAGAAGTSAVAANFRIKDMLQQPVQSLPDLLSRTRFCVVTEGSSPAIVSARFTPTRMKACCLPARRSF